VVHADMRCILEGSNVLMQMSKHEPENVFGGRVRELAARFANARCSYFVAKIARKY
jgi:hypothetical protein